ncbi:hypothetical protein AALO_G00172830 [Alosa alosa]|uniref:Uncharacterized protein n=1 Tax=Alosa alosa TaxID=278164 RepID=A0AAV6G7K1_9TELE|nr:uncharacterized protein LOC125306187 [Alosa alosa]XP_048117357.1 uncharacterized protein LOC125306187 [Alosa alosa]KAG5270835.1 hypothetical protein AALO_G00172830 [Alosa alosa]
MEAVVGRVVLSQDDAATVRIRMEHLLSTGALRPLTDMLVEHLRHLISEYDSSLTSEVPGTSVSASTIPQWRETDHIYAIVERFLKPFLGQLLEDVLAYLNKADVEGSERGSPSAASRSYIDITEDALSLLATMMVQEIMDDLFSRPDKESGQRSPHGRFTPMTGGASDQEAVEDCKATGCTEAKGKTTVSFEGNDYFSLISNVLVQLMRKIEPTTEDSADFTTFHCALTEKILSELCSASGLLRNELHPQSVNIQKICKKMHKDLLKTFVSKDMVHKLLVYRLPVFSSILTKCLVKELLRLSQGEAERAHRCKLFNFLQRFQLCRKVCAAFKKKNSRTNFQRTNKVQPMAGEVTAEN